MANYRLRFGAYDFPLTLRPAEEQGSQDLGAQERPRAEGAVSQVARRQSTTLQIRGELTAPDADTLYALHLALKAAVYAGKQSLWFGRDDRYYRDVQLSSFGTTYEDGKMYGLWAAYSLTFVASDYPLAFDVTPQTLALGVGASSYTVTPTGNASVLPTWTINVSAGGTWPIGLSNQTTGESCQLFGTFATGDVIVLARDGYRVTRNGATEFGLLSGRIPTLMQGPNVVSLTAGGGVTLGNASVAYTPRYA